MTGFVPSSLPSNATAFERAAGEGFSDVLPVPIREIVNPFQTPVAFLPFLAAHESVDLWFSDWVEARKRAMVAEAPVLARFKGTRHGAIRFLSYVDAEIIHAISYPARFVLGRAIIGHTPIGHPPFVARYLVKIVTHKPPRAHVIGRSPIGRRVLRTPSREPFNRALAALRAAKAPETEYRVSFAHKRPIQLSDGIPLDGSYRLGGYIDRRFL